VRDLNAEPLKVRAVNKAVATTIECRLHDLLDLDFAHKRGSSSSGTDLPALGYDVKVTSTAEP
jgi:hypothetical protein